MPNSANDGPVVALVPAAGRGVRLGESKPKAFVAVGGTPMLRLAVDGLIASAAVDEIIVVVPGELVESAAALLPGSDSVRVVAGGAERTDSVRAGITAAPDAAFFLVHDAARALAPPTLIANVVAELRAGQSAVVPALPVVDTIKSVDVVGMVTGTPDRAGLRAIQTPQGFAADVLRDAHALLTQATSSGPVASAVSLSASAGPSVVTQATSSGPVASAVSLSASAGPSVATQATSSGPVASAGGITDDAGLVELLGVPVMTIPGDPLAFKITTPLDLVLAQAVVDGVGVDCEMTP